MKTKKQTKFSLEKFEVAKLKNPKTIVGGANNTGDNTIGGTDSKPVQGPKI